MDILIPDNWLREFLKTKASPEDLQRCLSLCGPSVERIREGKTGPVYNRVAKAKRIANYNVVYSIEVTTNRVDSASVYGIAKEAAAILPRFKFPARLEIPTPATVKPEADTLPLDISTNPKLTKRVMAVVLQVTNAPSPDWLKNRLEDSGIRSLGSLIDITNYVMLETGHPTHVFDYDSIKTHKLIFRESIPGEKLTTLDKKTFKLPGGDIVIDDGTGEIVDLPGIMGTENSVVNKNTRRIIFFVDNTSPARIRQTSMSLGVRTQAASMNERGVDPELGMTAILRGIQLYKELANGKVVSKIHDIYPNPYKPKKITISEEFIEERLGIKIPAKEVTTILCSLGFGITLQPTTHNLTVQIPSYRALDVSIPEDIVEEIARIYGYHNIPSTLMSGPLPNQPTDSTFNFETKLKNTLKALDGTEVYTSSLVSKNLSSLPVLKGQTLQTPLKLKNPLGKEGEYLRMSLAPSVVRAVEDNKREKGPFHLFEISNTYLPKTEDLPEEKLMLAGVFANYDYRKAKGVVEQLLKEMRVAVIWQAKDQEGYETGRSLAVKSDKKVLGYFGYLNSGHLYYEFSVRELKKCAKDIPNLHPIPKNPPQVEDVNLITPHGVYLAEVIEEIKKVDKQITKVGLADVYEDTKTLRISYSDPEKTLTNSEVEEIRKKILKTLKEKLQISLK